MMRRGRGRSSSEPMDIGRQGVVHELHHPFVVGERFENRLGEFEVISIADPEMTIRLDDGTEIKTTLALQTRIVQNMQAEEDVAAEQAAARTRKAQRSSGFTGLVETDFQSGIGGTNWRARSSLGGLLAAGVANAASAEFKSHAVGGKPIADIARDDHYSKEIRDLVARFVLELDEERARFGFNIQREGGPLAGDADWAPFVEALAGDGSLQDKVANAMRKNDLRWELYDGEQGELIGLAVPAAKSGLEWREVDAEVEELDWLGFVAKIRVLAEAQGGNLYLCANLDKADAIGAYRAVANTIGDVYRDLLPLYEACAGPAE